MNITIIEKCYKITQEIDNFYLLCSLYICKLIAQRLNSMKSKHSLFIIKSFVNWDVVQKRKQ